MYMYIVLKSRCLTKSLCASVTNSFMLCKNVKNRIKLFYNLQTQLDTIKNCSKSILNFYAGIKFHYFFSLDVLHVP